MSKKPTVAFLLLLSGCSTTATISRVDGGTYTAKIVRSDQDSLFVKTSSNGSEIAIPRSNVSDIDHPGNGMAVFGALLTAYGGLNVAAGASTCGEVGGAYCVGTFLPAAVGLSTLIWGLTTWTNSTDAAQGGAAAAHTGAVPTPPSVSAFDFRGSAPGSAQRR